MGISICVIETCMDILDCRAEEIHLVSIDDECIGVLSNYVLYGWPSRKAEVQKEAQPHWSFRDAITVMAHYERKNIIIIIPSSLQMKALDQLHVNHMGIERMRLLAWESI